MSTLVHSRTHSRSRSPVDLTSHQALSKPAFECLEGQSLDDGRYEVQKKLGSGRFGAAWLAQDRREGHCVAIKMVKQDASDEEVAILQRISKEDPPLADGSRSSRCQLMHRCFTQESQYTCLVLELLGMSLRDILIENSFRGFCLADIRSISKQVLDALRFLHLEIEVAHLDLKTSNIVFQHNSLEVASCSENTFDIWKQGFFLP